MNWPGRQLRKLRERIPPSRNAWRGMLSRRSVSKPDQLCRAVVDALESRCLFVASFDLTGLTELRNDPRFVDVDGSDVTVAVLDSGIHAANPDLLPNVIGFYNAVADPVTTPVSPASVGSAFDLDGHGTHTAGIAASSNPDIGVAYASKIVSVKVLAGPGESQLGGSPLVRGLQWVALHAQELGIRVVNLSVGTATNVNTVTAALDKAEISRLINDLEADGITVVASSGNSYAQYVEPGATSIAAVSTISVASAWATTGRADNFNTPRGGAGDRYLAIESSASPDRIAAASQRSTLGNQVVAPGQDIYSTWNGINGDGGSGLYKVVSGTSMAAPFVSGLVALMQDAAFTFGGAYLSNPGQILQIIQETSDRIRDTSVADNSRYDSETGALLPLPETELFYSRVNASKAVARVVEIVTGGNTIPGGGGEPGEVTDLNAVRGTATIVPQLNARRSFQSTGSIGRDGVVDIGGADIDLFRISLETRGNLIVDLSLAGGSTFGGSLRLFNAAGAEIARADADPATGALPSLVTDPFAPLNTGTYYVGVSALPNTAYDIVSGNGVVAGSATGDYELSIALNHPDPDGIAQGAIDVDLTQPDEAIDDPVSSSRKVTVNRRRGILGSDEPPNGKSDRVSVDADVDMYRVVAPDNGTLEIDIDAVSVYGSRAPDTYVKVYDESLSLLAESDDDSFNSDSRVRLSAGRSQVYYIAVTVFGNRAFDASDPYNSRTPNSTPTDQPYDLLLWLDNGDTNGTANAATPLEVGATLPATIGSDGTGAGGVVGSTTHSKDVDWYRITASTSGLLEFNLTAVAEFAPSLSLWSLDASGRQITRIDNSAFGLDPAARTLSVQVTAGQTIHAAVTGLTNVDFNWFAVASGPGSRTGAYAISTSVLDPTSAGLLTNGSIQSQTPTPVQLGQTVTESIGSDGVVVVGGGDLDLFTYTPASTAPVLIRTIAGTENDADTFVRVFDSAGREIAFNDNALTDGKASRLIIELTGGETYYIGVSGAGAGARDYDALTGAGVRPGSTGRYSLVIEELPPGSASIRFGGKDIGTYTDVLGQTVTLKIAGPGTGRLQVDGASPSAFLLTLSDTTAATRLIVKGETTFGDVRISGPLKAFDAAGIALAGTFEAGGDVGVVVLGSALQGSGLSAASVNNVRVAGPFRADLNVAGDLGKFAGGELTHGAWNVGGNVRSIAAAVAADGWSAEVSGEIAKLKLQTLSGDVAAGSFHSVVITGAADNASVIATSGGVGALKAGRFDRSQLRAAADIAKVVVQSAQESLFYAGVSPAVTSLPESADDFTAASTIKRAIVRSGPFTGSNIAATTVRSASLRGVVGDNDGKMFGLAAATVDSLYVQDGPQWKKGRAPTVLAPVGDFVVQFI